MSSGKSDELKRVRFDYAIRNKELFEALIGLYGSDGLTYDEIAKFLNEKRENAAGLMIRLERGIQLRLISHDETSSLNDRKYFLDEEGKKIYYSLELSEYEKMIDLTMKIKEERKILEKLKEKERTRYII